MKFMAGKQDSVVDKEEVFDGNSPEDKEIRRIMEEHDIDEDTAEMAQELIGEGLDEDEAVEITEDM